MQPTAGRLGLRLWNRANLGALLVVALMLLGGGVTLVTGTGAASPLASPHGAAPSTAPVAPSTAPAPASTPSPAANGTNGTVDQVTGTFFNVNTTLALPPSSANGICRESAYFHNFTTLQEYIYEHFCIMGPQNPTLVSLGNGTVGVGYSNLTSDTPQASCLGPNNTTLGITSGVEFRRSSDSGQRWSNQTWISTGSCNYIQAFEPSFATASGTIYGAFVESNFTNPNASLVPTVPQEYAPRLSSRLAFTTSTDGGTNFSVATPIALAGDSNVSYPEIAAYGNTVYVVYMATVNTTNATLPSSAYGVAPAYPMSVDLVYSQDGGANWSGPIRLPALNATDYYTASSPSIAINATGGIAVSYATNRQCIDYFGFCYYYGDSIVVSTSTTNGTTWSGPYVAGALAGESPCSYYDPLAYSCLRGNFEWGPRSTVAFDPNQPSRVYVAWIGADYTWTVGNGSNEGGSGTTTNFGFGSALYAAVSTNGGRNWTQDIVRMPTSSTGYEYDVIEAPALTVSASGMVYLSYTWINETYCPSVTCPFSDLASYWVATSTNGLTWSNYVTYVASSYYYYITQDWTGLTSAVTTTTAGPVAVYSEGLGYTFSYAYSSNLTHSPPIYIYTYNYTYASQLIDAYPSSHPPLAINFTETGLPAHLNWTLDVSGNAYRTNATTIQITNVPVNATLYIDTPPILPADTGWTEIIGTVSVGAVAAFSQPTTVLVNFSYYFGTAFHITPWGLSGVSSTGCIFTYVEVFIAFQGNYQYVEYYVEQCGGTVYTGNYSYPAAPWYFPQGTQFSMSTIAYTDGMPLSYVFGSGNGSATGVPSQVEMTVNGPINETYVVGALGFYNLSFVPEGLTSGTPYYFTFNGVAYNATAPARVSVRDVLTGSYSLTGVYALPSGSPGWIYYASNLTSEVQVPLEVQVDLNFTTEVDVGATAGTVSFEASGLSSGSFWQMSFNGTTYGSSTPWINLTAHPGTYAVSATPVASAINESTAYAPRSFGPTLSVSPGNTYLLQYTLSYRVVVSTSSGGTVTGAGAHWATPGSTASYTATAQANYQFLGWAGAGNGSYSGPSASANITVNSPITESARFQPLPGNRFPLAVTETGLPNGTWWTVEVGGMGYSTNQSILVVNDLYSCAAGPLGTYNVSVPYAYVNGSSGVRYVASGFPGTTCTTGTTSLTLSFETQYLVTPQSGGDGTAYATVGGLATTTPSWVKSGSPVSLSATPSQGYQFAGWLGTGSGSYTGSLSSQVITPYGPVSELALFTLIVVPPPPRYTATFELGSTLAAGTAWSITFNGTTYASTASSINISGLLAGTYALRAGPVYSSDRSTEYAPHTLPASLAISGNLTTTVSYATAYLVSITASDGGTVSPSGASYYGSGQQIPLVATPAAGYEFVGWVGAGPGAYTGASPNGTASVSGPISEIATFELIPTTAPASGNFLTSTTGIVVLALVGLVVGLGVGLAIFRRRRAPPAPPQSWSPDGGSP